MNGIVGLVSAAYFEHAIPAGKYRGWLAETDQGQVVAGGGVVIADWPGHPRLTRPHRAWILNMYTEPTFRGQGIARRLMETMVAWCRREGFVAVSLHASDEGRALYESMGFQPTNEMRLELG